MFRQPASGYTPTGLLAGPSDFTAPDPLMIEVASNKAAEYGLDEFPVATHTNAGSGSPSGSLSVGVALCVGVVLGSDVGVADAEAVGSGFLPGSSGFPPDAFAEASEERPNISTMRETKATPKGVNMLGPPFCRRGLGSWVSDCEITIDSLLLL